MSADAEIAVKKLDVKPSFDMIGFMEMCQETRMEGHAAELMITLWDRWLDLLQLRAMTCGKIGYVAVWLPEDVETTVDEIWDKTPSEGYLSNCLAQYLCMQAVSEVIPQIADTGCAPAPKPTETLRKALAGFGLEYREDMDVLKRRFAVVTRYPFRGGCEVCHLQKECPKGQGGDAQDGSVLLPGFEHSAAGK